MENITVKCDKCDWKEENSSVIKWHLKPCPKCHNSIIINDADLMLFNTLNVLKCVAPATNDEITVNITINTAPMREGKSPDIKIKRK